MSAIVAFWVIYITWILFDLVCFFFEETIEEYEETLKIHGNEWQ